MPMTTWEDIAGKSCEGCGGYATHWYGGRALCCDCHGGGICSQEEAKEAHEKVLAPDYESPPPYQYNGSLPNTDGE